RRRRRASRSARSDDGHNSLTTPSDTVSFLVLGCYSPPKRDVPADFADICVRKWAPAAPRRALPDEGHVEVVGRLAGARGRLGGSRHDDDAGDAVPDDVAEEDAGDPPALLGLELGHRLLLAGGGGVVAGGVPRRGEPKNPRLGPREVVVVIRVERAGEPRR